MFLPLLYWSLLHKNHFTWKSGKFIRLRTNQCNRFRKTFLKKWIKVKNFFKSVGTILTSSWLIAILFHFEQIEISIYYRHAAIGPGFPRSGKVRMKSAFLEVFLPVRAFSVVFFVSFFTFKLILRNLKSF